MKQGKVPGRRTPAKVGGYKTSWGRSSSDRGRLVSNFPSRNLNRTTKMSHRSPGK